LVLLNDAILPNLAQTTEHVPALIHTGPFANIAHGTSSVLAQRMGLKLAEYVVNESGFGADLGAEKYFDIVLPSAGLKPSVAVLIATVRALAAHGAAPGLTNATGPAAVERGLANLARHLDNLRKYHVPVVIAINRFTTDTKAELDVVQDFCRAEEVESAIVDVYEQGGAGALELAEKVIALAEASYPEEVCSLYSLALSLEEKVERVAKEIYGATTVYFEAEARKKLKKFTELGYGQLPVCLAKTQSSFSDNPKLLGAPTGWTLTVRDANLAAGAGFIVVVAGSMMLMPGLPRTPQAARMNVDTAGHLSGVS
jgi:formate--tetrahydrofolate ligase